MNFRNYGKTYNRLTPKDSQGDIERSKRECDLYFKGKHLTSEPHANNGTFDPLKVEMVISRYGRKYHERKKRPVLVKLSPYAKQLWNMTLEHQPKVKYFKG